MLRTASIAVLATVIALPAYAGCAGYNHSASADASTQYSKTYTSTAASTTTVEDGAPLQSTPIDDSTLVYELDAEESVLEDVVTPEG